MTVWCEQSSFCSYSSWWPARPQLNAALDGFRNVTKMKSRAIVKGGLVGLGYGALLSLLAFWAAGAGHGTYIPVAISSAPAGFVGVLTALIATPVLWSAFGALVNRRGYAHRARVLLVLHYVSGLLLVATTQLGDTGNLRYVIREGWTILFAWALVYTIGQVTVWRQLSKVQNVERTV